MTGFDLTNDVTVTGGTKPGTLTESATQGEAGKVWTGTFTATGSTGDLEITVAQDSVQDNAGNTGPAADVSQTATRDTAAPTVTITDVPAYVKDTGTAFTATFTFNEAVTGFGDAVVTVTHATTANFTENSASEYTVAVTPNGNGNVVVTVAQNAATDLAGNTGPAADGEPDRDPGHGRAGADD